MKNILLTFLTFNIYCILNAQNFVGKYSDNSGSQLELKSDSSFKYSWRFDLVSSWSVGKWILKNDTIIFQVNPIYDTLRIPDKITGLNKDTLVLSSDEVKGVIDNTQFALETISSGGQNRFKMPKQLYVKKEKLYYL